MSDASPSAVEVTLVGLASPPPAEALAACHALLDGGERERAAQFRHGPSREQFIVARGTLRQLLSEREPNIAPDGWRFVAGPHGKPRVAEGLPPIEFNVSHTDGLIAIAVSRGGPVGIDVERADRVVDVRDFARLLSPDERAELDALVGDAQRRRFLAIWTAKEAYAKAVGTGLSESLARVTIADAEGAPRVAENSDWHLHRFDAGASHIGAIALRGDGRPAVRWMDACQTRRTSASASER